MKYILVAGSLIGVIVLTYFYLFSGVPSVDTEASRALASDQEDVRSIGLNKKEPNQKIITGPKVALVIGNSTYKRGPLKNPANDAKLIAETLSTLNFKVTLVTNSSLEIMKRQISTFGKKLKTAEVGLFYYAGHGMQVKGHNYLIPIGNNINSEADVDYEAIDTGYILAKMESGQCPVNIVILDACRDNPFARSFRSNSGQGLAFMDAPVGTIIGYATSPGSVAMDGRGSNSLYSHTFARYIQQPGLKIEDVFKLVRRQVRTDTKGQQVPWESTSLEGDFFFTKAMAGQSYNILPPTRPRKVAQQEPIAKTAIPEPIDKEESTGSNNDAFLLFSDSQRLKQANKFDQAQSKLNRALQLVTKGDKDFQNIYDERYFHLPIAKGRLLLRNHQPQELQQIITELDNYLRQESSHPNRYQYSQMVDELRTAHTYLGVAIANSHKVFERSFQMAINNYFAEYGTLPLETQQVEDNILPYMHSGDKYKFNRFGINGQTVWAEFTDNEQGNTFRVEAKMM